MIRTSGKLFRTVVSPLLATVMILVSAPAALAEDRINCAYPYWFGFAPVPVAIEVGYFAEEGLEVETVFDNDRANVLPGLEIGDIDCTMRTGLVILLYKLMSGRGAGEGELGSRRAGSVG